MLSIKLGRKKSGKDDKITPKPTRVQSEPTSNIFKEAWWLFVVMFLLIAAIVVGMNWDKIEPFIQIP